MPPSPQEKKRNNNTSSRNWLTSPDTGQFSGQSEKIAGFCQVPQTRMSLRWVERWFRRVHGLADPAQYVQSWIQVDPSERTGTKTIDT